MEHSLSLKLLQYQKGFEIRPTILLLLACLTSSSITRGEKPAFIAQSRHNKCQKIFFPFYFCYFYEDRVERRYALKKKKKITFLFASFAMQSTLCWMESVCISICVLLLPSPTADNAVCVPQIRAFILLPSRWRMCRWSWISHELCCWALI